IYSQPSAPTDLRTENLINPLYVEDPTPDFSWSASTQSFYQVLVSTSKNNLNLDIGEMWNSGKVTSTVTGCVYSGIPLSGNTTYYWKVRVWDINNDTSPWSSIASFRMNFFLLKSTFTGLTQTQVFGFGDFDNDGDFDLVEGSWGDKIDLHSYLNDGGGNFTLTFSTYDSIYVYSLSVSDFNLDGNLDIFTGITEGPLTKNQLALKGKGDGSFSILYNNFSKQKAVSSAIGDLNLDGKMDIVCGIEGGYNLYYFGNGDGTFSSASTFSSENEPTMSVALGDIDNDGDIDIVTANYGYDDSFRNPLYPIRVYENNGAGNFSQIGYSVNDYYHTVLLADVDSDGDLDIISGVKFPTGGNNTANRIFLNDGEGNFGESPFSPSLSFGKRTELGDPDQYPQVENLVFADFDHDGDGDILLCNSGGGRIKVELYLNDGNGNFTFLDEYNIQAKALAVFDFDSDGDLDFIASGEDEEIRIYYSTLAEDGKQNFLPQPPSNLSYSWNSQNNKLTLRWGNGNDSETPQSQLTYNLKLGTSKEGNDVNDNIISGKISQVQSESSLFIGNMHYSTSVVLNIERKTYFFQVQTIDLQKGLSPWSNILIVNEEPHAGWDNADVLISTTCHQYNYEEVKNDPKYPSLRGKVKISFRIRDYEKNTCTLTSFAYSYDGGNTWYNLSDDSTALEYFKSDFSSDIDFSGEIHNFYWNTTDIDNDSVIRSTSSSNIKIRFKAFDGYTTGPYEISENFTVDNEMPTKPGNLLFSGETTANSITLNFTTQSTDSHFYGYVIYYNNKEPVGEFDYIGYVDKNTDLNLAYYDFGGASSITISGLNENTTYYFILYAYDEYANSNYSSVTEAKTNDIPSLQTLNFSQRKDGTGLIDVGYKGYDVDNDSWSYVLFKYKLSGTTEWFDLTPKTDDEFFTSPLKFSSTGYFNNFVWDSKADLDNFEGQVTLLFEISDGKDTVSFSPGNIVVDNKSPQGLGNLKVSKAYSSKVQLEWNAATDISNFKYELWYSTFSGILRDTSTFNFWGEVMPSGESVESGWVGSDEKPLDAGKLYYFKVFAVDDYENVSESNEVSQLTGSGPDSIINEVKTYKDGTGRVKIEFDVISPDKLDTFIKVSFSTVSSNGPFYNIEISTTDFEFYVSTGASFYPVNPPSISNSSEYQIGSSINPVLTSSGTVRCVIYWLAKEDLLSFEGSFYIKIDVKDVFNVSDSAPPVYGPEEIDTKNPYLVWWSYSHGSYSDYTSGESAILQMEFSEFFSTETLSISGFCIQPLKGDFSESITIEKDEIYSLMSDTTVVKIYLSKNKWEKIATWDREGKGLYLYISSGSVKDLFYNVIKETTVFVSHWSKDRIRPYITGASYVSEGGPRLILDFNEKILSTSFTTETVKGIVLYKEKVSTTPYKMELDFIQNISTTSPKTYILYFPEEKHFELVSWGVDKFYLTVSTGNVCSDISGNLLKEVLLEDALLVNFFRDLIPPSIVKYIPTSTSPVKADSVKIFVYFDDSIKEDTITDSILLYPYKDSSGKYIENPIRISGITNYYSELMMIEFIPSGKLEEGYTYRVEVSTKITDLSGNNLKDSNRIWYFETYRDFGKENIVYNSSFTVKVIISSNAIKGYGMVLIEDAENLSKVIEANLKEDRINGFHYPIEKFIVNLKVFDENGKEFSGIFNNDVYIVMNYPDSEQDGIVDGTNPPVRERTLGIYFLDEDNSRWIRLPSSVVDTEKNEVSAKIKHFSVYALFGGPEYSLSDVIVYPNPYQKKKDKKNQGITFQGLPSECKISIYTLSGKK
ncbi:MAG: hypothetical protein DRI36_04460, partial [Caldiserica bacterium]